MARRTYEFDPMAVAGGCTDANRETRAAIKADGVVAAGRDQLRSIVERIERLEEEKKTIGDDIKDVYAEAKATGFDTKAVRRVIALRKKDAQERAEEEAVLETYLIALGMQASFDFEGEK